MTPKIKRQELINLREKILQYNQSINPQTKQGEPVLLLACLKYENILLHRHRVKPAKDYRIDPNDGSIIHRPPKLEISGITLKRQPIQEPVKA